MVNLFRISLHIVPRTPDDAGIVEYEPKFISAR